MKTKSLRKIKMLIVAGIVSAQFANAQTYGSGTLTNTCTSPAGLGGANSVNLGCGAGNKGGANRTTFIGDHAGFLDGDNADNVGVGYNALYTIGLGAYSGYNVAVGNNALQLTKPTTSSNATQNTAIGHNALTANTTGSLNSALGYNALFTNQTNVQNTAIGGLALYTNAADDNTAVGYNAMYYNTTGTLNVAVGAHSLRFNTTGEYNTAVGLFAAQSLSGGGATNSNSAFGYGALSGSSLTGSDNTAIGRNSIYGNTTGYANTSVGESSLGATTTGYDNAALGYYAGATNTTGNSNTFVGYGADIGSTGTLSNVTALGNGAICTTAHGSNTMQIGNAAITNIYSQPAAWTSDGRFKFNVKEQVQGLVFINKLRPVTYQMDTKKLDDFTIMDKPDSVKAMHRKGMDFEPSTNITHSGFIAQEVEKAAADCKFTSSIVVKPIDVNTGSYALSYSEIVVPLVKAVQELSRSLDSLSHHSKKTDSLLLALQNCCNSSSQRTRSSSGTGSISGSDQGNSENITHVELANNIMLYQNEPNPFGENTVIRYFIPENTTSTAYIVFYDMYGKEMQKNQISTKGFGNINANTLNLSAGIYSYSLIVDERVVDTKKMMRNK